MRKSGFLFDSDFDFYLSFILDIYIYIYIKVFSGDAERGSNTDEAKKYFIIE